MKIIYVKNQAEFDKIKRVEKDEEVIVEVALRLNFRLEVFGKLRLRAPIDCNRWDDRLVEARENSSVVAWGNSSVEAWGNSSVVARENSSVVAWGNSSVEAWGNSSVVARENSSVVARENSSVEARENSSVEAWGNSSVVARENSSVVARENSSVVAWGNSSVEAWGNSVVRALSDKCKAVLHGFAVCFAQLSLKFDFELKSKFAIVQRYKDLGWFEANGVQKKAKVILYKKVSKDFKTQENTSNETLWKVGATVAHPSWSPKESECGTGKFHACSRPYFCDEFRSGRGDRYVAIEVNSKDLFEWKNPQYIHKIAFRKGKVLFECDKTGKAKLPIVA